MLHNPILPGFHADPCVCRRGEDYYVACSSFEWFPSIPVYHSRDLKHWELYTHILTDESRLNLTGLPSGKGIWAPCLTYCNADDRFYVVYGVMRSMNARYFDIDNFLITAKDITGPWSEPVYLSSAGFDASLYHGEDGREWLLSLQWETRDGYRKPGPICLAEYSPEKKRLLGYPKPISYGSTNRGCLEGPHLYKHGEYYYLLCAEGGTGYYHCTSVARSKNIWGPYEGDPCNPILTSNPEEHDETENIDHLKPQYYNPEAALQKAGHGSLIETQTGEVYLLHHCARPFLPELRCTLGRETAIQKMEWTKDGWLRIQGGGNLPREWVEESHLPEAVPQPLPDRDDFETEALDIRWCAPRIDPASFVNLHSRPGWLRMRGQEAATSLNRVSMLARVLTCTRVVVTTKLEFHPEIYQHSAGLILYYDNMNFAYLRKYYSERLGGSALSVVRVENGVKTTCQESRTPAGDGALYFRLIIDGRDSRFSWSADGERYRNIGPVFDTSRFSDEYSEFGEFTGTFVGITCWDRMFHEKCADFEFFEYREKD